MTERTITIPEGGATSTAQPDPALVAVARPALPAPDTMKRKPHILLNRAWGFLHKIRLGKVSLDENSLIAQARKETGLHYFGDESFVEPLRHVLYSLQHESKTNPMGDFFARQNIVRLLKNRLRANELFVRHPEILQRSFVPPVLVVGLARSGTTRTHRLLACDPQFVHLKTWEVVQPAPYPQSFMPAGQYDAAKDPRYIEIDYGLKVVDYLMPQMRYVHPLGTEEVEEEAGLIQHGFETSLFSAMNIMPSYFEWYIQRDSQSSYEYMVKLMKLISWFRQDDPEKPWILKTPEHMVNFRSLMQCFPDARIVSTHRDPLAVLSSLMSMAWMALVRDYDELDPLMIARQWKQFVDVSINNYLSVRDSELVDESQLIDLRYADINRDWQAEVEKMYRHFSLPLSQQALDNMAQWMSSNRQDKHGSHHHSLEQFGFRPEAIERDYAAYRARFSIPHSSQYPAPARSAD